MKNSEINVKNFMRLSWPVIISHATIILVGIIDLIFVRNLGTTTSAAVAIANNVCIGIYAIFEGIRSGTTVLTARFFGAKQKEKITQTLNISLFTALSTGLFILLTSFFISKTIFMMLGTLQTRDVGSVYLFIRLLGAPLILTFLVIEGFFRGLKDTFTPFLITLSICSCNVVFNYLFLHTFPKMELNSIASATVLAYFVGAILSLLFLFKRTLAKRFINFKKSFTSLWKEYFKIIIEIGIYITLIETAFIIFTYMFKQLGTATLAAHQITFNIYMVAYLPAMGFFAATSIIVGNLLGAKKGNLAIKATLKICYLCTILALGLNLLIFVFSPQLGHWLSPTNFVVAILTSKALKLASISCVFNTIYVVLRGALIGAKDTRFIIYEGIVTSFAIFLPLVYLLGITLGYGAVGGYLAFLIWGIVDAAVFAWRFFINKGWQKINAV